MRCTAPVALLATTVAVAGCRHVGGSPQAPAGAGVFAGNCRACHSLVGNESRHRQGGDLAGYRLTRQELVQFTREMPTRRPLTSAQLDVVVDYVLEFQRRGRAR